MRRARRLGRGGAARAQAALLIALLAPLPAIAAPPPAPPAEAPEAHAARLLGELREATGGTAWDPVKLLHLTARLGEGEVTGNEESWIDPVGGRLLDSLDDGPGAGLSGFDGKTAWSAEIGGEVRSESGPARSARIAEAFMRTLGWLRPTRARPVYVRADAAGGRHCDVLELTPEAGVTLELWLDRSSHLPVRAVVPGGQAVQFSMWRKIQGAALPWHEEIEAGPGQPHWVREISRVEVNPSFDAARFAPPASAPADYSFPREAASVELSMKLVNGHVFIPAHIGKEPLRLMFDTGSTLVLDAQAASRAGLVAKGQPLRVPEIKVGGIALRRQSATIADLAGLSAVEGVPVDGVIGADLARRLVVELDYDGQRMVLLRPDGFVPPPAATAMPLTFVGLLPTVEGRIDGIPARLVLDTGRRPGLVVSPAFAAAHGLAAKWHARPGLLIGWDAQGALSGALGHAASLEIGVLGLAQPLAVISARPLPAGDALLGGATLRRFDAILDYRHGQLWLQTNREADRPDDYDHAGLWLNQPPKGDPVVAAVAQGGPAARAGLQPGDLIVTVNGDSSATLTLSELRERLEGPPGSAISFGIRRGEEHRDARLLLADPLALPPESSEN